MVEERLGSSITACMEYSDKGFEEFQDLLRPFRESHPLLWRIRDSLYAALYYRVPGSNPGKTTW